MRAYNQSYFTFSSLNAYIMKGEGAQGMDMTFASLMVRANDEPYAAGIGYEPRLYDNFAPYAYEPGGQYDASAADEDTGARIVVLGGHWHSTSHCQSLARWRLASG